jgi:hypothetical protein
MIQMKEHKSVADRYGLDTPVYHSKVRIKGMEALVLDIGAFHNLSGSEWMARQAAEARAAGAGSLVKTALQNAIEVEGVGNGSQSVTHSESVPICLEDGSTGDYEAATLPNSQVPGLLGLNSLRRKRGLIDTFNNKLYTIGPGGYTLKVSPGSKVHELHDAPSGHLLLPVSMWKQKSVDGRIDHDENVQHHFQTSTSEGSSSTR